MKIDLYEFNRGSTTWRKTNAPSDIVYLSETFEASTIGRGSLGQSQEINKSNLEVRIDKFDPFAVELVETFVEQILTITLFIQTDVSTRVAWKGRLLSILPKEDKLVLSFENIFTSLKRPGLRARYQKTCRHFLYGRGCGLDPEAFAVSGVVSALDNETITVPEAALQPDGYYLGGMLRDVESGALGFIVQHVGEVLTIQRPLDSLITVFNDAGYGVNYGNFYGGAAVKLYPGCDRLRQTCKDKFDNIINFGGFPWIPSRNPMDGNSII
jgi:hypothetical protein